LAFWEVAPTIKAEIWLLTVAPERRVRPLIQTPFNNSQPRISPDGHWLAYVSDETGQDEVYVQPFPALGAKRQISKDGGCCPRWASHERELFYLNGESMMAVEVQTRPTFTAGAARPLFAYASPNGVYDYDVAPDGRFITIQSAAPTTQITLIQNWFEELKLRVPK
jgi:Tol biopolymer transport system component